MNMRITNGAIKTINRIYYQICVFLTRDWQKETSQAVLEKCQIGQIGELTGQIEQTTDTIHQ